MTIFWESATYTNNTYSLIWTDFRYIPRGFRSRRTSTLGSLGLCTGRVWRSTSGGISSRRLCKYRPVRPQTVLWVLGHCQNLPDLLLTISQDIHEVLLNSCLLGDLVQKPYRAILSVNILLVIFHPSPFLLTATPVLAQVTPRREDQFLTFCRTRIEVGGVGMKPIVFVDESPMLMPIHFLTLRGSVIYLCRRIAASAVDMNYYPVRSLLPDPSASLHKRLYYSANMRASAGGLSSAAVQSYSWQKQL